MYVNVFIYLQTAFCIKIPITAILEIVPSF